MATFPVSGDTGVITFRFSVVVGRLVCGSLSSLLRKLPGRRVIPTPSLLRPGEGGAARQKGFGEGSDDQRLHAERPGTGHDPAFGIPLVLRCGMPGVALARDAV